VSVPSVSAAESASAAPGRVVPEGVDVSHRAILYLEDITVSFDGFKALNRLTLTIDAGELRCVIGPNGAGKTTMRTQGFWKTHGPDSPGGQENAWPVSSISIGGEIYSALEAIAIMNASTEGNAISSLFQQLVAYKLNVLNSVIPTADEVAAAALADDLIEQATGGNKLQIVSGNTLNYVVDPSSTLGQQMIAAMGILTDFNESGV
jgi:ABC-type dipeptide/oligopeptide/nickel transport system ATPase component